MSGWSRLALMSVGYGQLRLHAAGDGTSCGNLYAGVYIIYLDADTVAGKRPSELSHPSPPSP
jgi:hypothetical protein